MKQHQLFDAGQVKVYSTRGLAWMNSAARRERNAQTLLAQLVGTGRIRRHRVTNKPYVVEAGRPRLAHARYCSVCGSQVLRSSREIKDSKLGVFLCSNECQSRWVTAYKSAPLGSKQTNEGGYVAVKTEAGWELEHRVVMATALGRVLLSTETVHHLDGDRSNNDLSNLQLRRGQHGPGQAHQCRDCGSFDIEAVPLEGRVPPTARTVISMTPSQSPFLSP
jgi:hypothetical protein